MKNYSLKDKLANVTCITFFFIFILMNTVNGQVKGIEHVFVIGCDGMSARGVQEAVTPNINMMMRNGAFTFHGRAVMPTSSSSNWASMMMGAGPEQHGITSNSWERNFYTIAPTDTGTERIFPTIFSIIKQQKPQLKTASFYDWSGFGRLLEHSSVDYIGDTDGPDKTMEAAIDCFKKNKPALTFIQLDNCDHYGHSYGYDSEKYLEEINHTDHLIGLAIKAVKDAGLEGSTVIIVTADHGGIGKGHGGETMQEIEIPWIIYGPGIFKGKQITLPFDTFDTAATIAFMLGLKQPYSWIARPALSAFKKYDTEYPGKSYKTFLPLVHIAPIGGNFKHDANVTLSVDAPNSDIFYTTDGTEPIRSSKKYKAPLYLNEYTVLKAKAFDNNSAESETASAEFKITNPTSPVGINYFSYEGNYKKIPDFKNEKLLSSGRIFGFDLKSITHREDHYAVKFSGFINITEPGEYIFTTISDDGSKLYIDDKLVVDNDGSHSAEMKSGKIKLAAGVHSIRLDYFDDTEDETLQVYYQGPGISNREIPAGILHYKK